MVQFVNVIIEANICIFGCGLGTPHDRLIASPFVTKLCYKCLISSFILCRRKDHGGGMAKPQKLRRHHMPSEASNSIYIYALACGCLISSLRSLGDLNCFQILQTASIVFGGAC